MEPMLRFKADDGSDFPAWEEKALSEIAARVTRKNKGNQTDIPLTISSLDGLVDQRDYFKKTVASKDMSGYFLLRNGEFAYNKSYSVGFDYGSIKRLDKYPCGALSTLYICFGLKPNVKVDSGYLAYYFDSQKWNPEVAAICAEGARNHGLLNVPTADFFNINIAVPPLPEQHKIADLLSAVDDVIAAQEAEVAAWEKRKKGVMQKLFSQEVRFKADDGSDFPDWEEKTLGELANLFTGKSFTSELSESGRYVVMDMGSVSSDGLIIDSKLTDSNRDLLRKGDLIMPKDDIGGGLIIGKTAYIPCDKKYVCGDHVYRLRFDNGIDALFMHYEINSSRIQRRLRRKVTGSAQLGLNSKSVLYEIVSVPSFPEQRKIADCLISLDDVITKAKDELDAWRELKKGLLQQMFV